MNILIVDDTEVNVVLLQEVCKKKGHHVTSFLNPLDAVESLQNNQYDVAFIDYMMPQMDGITLIEHIKKSDEETMCVMVTAANENEVKIKALEAGANEFLSKPIDISEIMIRLNNATKLIEANKLTKEYNKTLKSEVKEATKMLVDAQYESLAVLSTVAEYRDEDTHLHTKRVSHYSKLIAMHSGLDEETQDLIFYASSLHDIGKIGVPDGILLKPAKLTDDEFVIMKKHATIGDTMLKDFTQNKYLKAGATIALTHHEKFNGEGYPYGLKGDEIDIMGQIVAIADVFDALTSVRPYKNAWDTDKAFDFFKEESGKHFNPFFTQIFLNIKDEILEVYNTYKD